MFVPANIEITAYISHLVREIDENCFGVVVITAPNEEVAKAISSKYKDEVQDLTRRWEWLPSEELFQQLLDIYKKVEGVSQATWNEYHRLQAEAERKLLQSLK